MASAGRFLVAVLFVALSAHLHAAMNNKIDTVVVLMLENRSFDHMLGFLKQNDSRIEGCLPNMGLQCSNPLDPTNSSSPRVFVNPNAVYEQVSDPNHGVTDTTYQVYGYGPTTVDPAPMTGFIKNYDHGEVIMACFPPEHVPAMAALASEFATFDHWHADVPGPTEVNRFYANSGTSHGSGANDDLLLALGYPQRSIFNSLDDSEYNTTWAVYFQLVPSAIFFSYLREPQNLVKFHSYDQFLVDAANGALPTYSWVEPRYFQFLGDPANDQHPDHDVNAGDELIAMTYNALRASPKWNSTLFIVMYDEHGGFFDHVAPPINVPNPDGLNATDVSPPFNFTRLGVRIPVVMASPWIPKNTAVGKAPVNSYSHSSLPATIRKLFTPDQPFLTARDAWSCPFDDVMSLDEPRTDCPMTLPTAPSHRGTTPGLSSLADAGKLTLNSFQKSMVKAASVLNHGGQLTETGDGMTEDDASVYLALELNQFFGREIVRPSAPAAVMS